MKQLSFIIIIGVFFFASTHIYANAYKMNIMNKQDTTELAAINETITKVFAAISFTKGNPSNMHQLEGLFIEQGMLINYNEATPLILGVKEFIQHFEKQFADGMITELEDKEVHHQTEIYDKIAHRFSFYEARFKSSDTMPFAVGVNSMQLVKVDGQWLVSSMAWNDDNRGNGFFERMIFNEKDE